MLLPGGLTGWLSWIPHAQRLSQSRKVIRAQLCNVALGLSGGPLPPDYSAAFEIAAFSRLVDDLSLDNFDLAGWSYGALIALSYAMQNPQRIRTLTLIETSAYWALRTAGPLPRAVLAEQRFFQTLATDKLGENQLIALVRFAGLVPDAVDPRTLPDWSRWYSFRQSLRIGDAEYRHEDRLDRVSTFEPPVLLVKGEGSNPHTHAIADLLAGIFPNVKLVTLPGGHAPHIVSMESFLEIFTNFLQ